MMRYSLVKVGAAAMRLAADPFVTRWLSQVPSELVTTELANAVATAVSMAETDEERDVYAAAIGMINTRSDRHWIWCPKKEECARAMQRAWEQTTGEQHGS